MDTPGVRQVPEGSGEQGKMEKTVCKIICDAPTTLAVKELMMMMMMIKDDGCILFSKVDLQPLPPPPPTTTHDLLEVVDILFYWGSLSAGNVSSSPTFKIVRGTNCIEPCGTCLADLSLRLFLVIPRDHDNPKVYSSLSVKHRPSERARSRRVKSSKARVGCAKLA